MENQIVKTTPPQTLDQLKDLLSRLQTGDASTRLGKQAQRTLAAMVDSPHQTAVYSISELAETIGVNASTLTRLAKRLGYEGFSDFQAIFRRQVADEENFYSKRAGRLLDADQASQPGLTLLAKVAEDETANIGAMLKTVDAQTLEETAKLLAHANRVRIHGARQFFSAACFMSYALGMLRRDVAVLGGPEHGVGHALAQLDEGDVLVVLGCSPYTRTTVDACRIAKAHGMPLVAITDSYASPLAAFADQTFVTPTGGLFFSNSMAASLVLAEGMLSLVARRLGDDAVKALKHREDLIRELSIEI